MEHISLDYSKVQLTEENPEKLVNIEMVLKIKEYLNTKLGQRLESKALEAKKTLVSRSGSGREFLGWLDLPVDYDKEEYQRIKKAAEKIRNDSDVLVVIGIGGSYLGARAAEEFLGSSFKCGRGVKGNPDIYYAGNSLSSVYLNDLIKAIGDRDFSINVISKSGTTTEPAIAFRVLKKLIEDKYGKEEASKRIYATTDKKKGALKTLADANGYETFVVPDNVGGRFSVLTAVGLLPIAVSGADIDELMAGAASMRRRCFDLPLADNDAITYAMLRYVLYEGSKTTEVLANYEPYMHYVAEWWKQLFGESEGKNGKGIFPASVDLTTDLHSMGQYIQDGVRNIFETVVNIVDSESEVNIFEEESDLDGLNYLAGKNMDFVNKNAMKGTVLAHNDGDVPVMIINVPKRNAFYLGELFYFFEFAVGISGYMLKVNPFDQPGVESYKRNMFALLGKPGYEEEREILLERLEEKNE